MRKLLVISFIFILCSWQNLFANDIAVMPKFGSAGLGADIIFFISEKYNARIGMNKFSYDSNSTISDINYDYDIQLSTIPILLDYYPFASSSFKLSTGLIINNNEVSGNAKASDNLNIPIGLNKYAISLLGELKADITFQKICPYIGFGWGGNFEQNQKFALLFDFGIIYHGQPKANLEATNPLLNMLFQEDIKIEEKAIEDEISKYKVYPVISLGFAFKF